MSETYNDWLAHHGIKGQKWGKLNGPPYPLSDAQRSATENKKNPTSASARKLATLGLNNRFRESVSVTDSGTGGGSSSKSSSSSSSGEKKEGHHYSEDLTRENRMEMLKRLHPEKYTPKVRAAEEEKKSTKSSKSTKTVDPKVAETKARNEWVKEGKSKIDEVFGEDIGARTFKSLLDEFYNGTFSKNYKGEGGKELEKEFDENGKEIEKSEGENFYKMLMSRFDSNEKGYKEFKEGMDWVLSDPDLGSLEKLSKSISLLANYANEVGNKDGASDDSKAYAKLLNHFDNKLKHFFKYHTNNSRGKGTLSEAEAYEEIEELLKKSGF